MMHEFYARFAKWLAAVKDAGAPGADEVGTLLGLLSRVSFAPPSKVGRRTFDDRKFVDSVREKFDADGKVTDKQFAALLSIAGRYVDQLPAEELEKLPEHLRGEIGMAEIRSAERRKRQEDSAEQRDELDAVFDNFRKVKYAPAVTRGKRTYDDEKFVSSLREQVRAGRPLSEKQIAALRKLAAKYLEQFPDRAAVAGWLGGDAPAADPAQASAVPAPAVVDPAAAFARLSGVKKWAEPVRKGRFSFDDRKFFLSLKQQFDSGKSLSPKQLAALGKLDAKYMG